MAMKRKATRTPRRRFVKRRRMMGARRTKRGTSTVLVKRTNFGGTWTFGSAATNDFWRYLDYDMTAFNNFAEFANIFDEYKVNAMKITFRPSYDSIVAPVAAGSLVQPQAYMHYVVDPGSSTIPTGTYSTATVNTFLEQSNVRTKTLRAPISIYFKPKVLSQNLGSGTGAVVERPQWTRTTETGTRHRGVHVLLQQNSMSTGNTNIKLDVFITYYVQFRNLK